MDPTSLQKGDDLLLDFGFDPFPANGRDGGRDLFADPTPRPIVIVTSPATPDPHDRLDETSTDEQDYLNLVRSSAEALDANSRKIETIAEKLESAEIGSGLSTHHVHYQHGHLHHHQHHHHHQQQPHVVLKKPGYDLLGEGQSGQVPPVEGVFDLSQVFSKFRHQKKQKHGKKMSAAAGRFRSGSVEADKSQNFSLGLDEAGSRSRSYSSTDSENGTKRDSYNSTSPRHPSNEKVWVIASPFSPPLAPGPPLNGMPKQTPGFLSELSLQSTPVPVNAGSSPTSRPRSGSALSPMTANELHDSVLSALGSDASDSSAGKVSLEKKVSSKQKPKGTIEYKVKDGDTLVKIGAHFDVTPSELIKINRLVSRTVFVGQTLFIPDPGHVPSDPPTPPSPPPPDTRPKVIY